MFNNKKTATLRGIIAIPCRHVIDVRVRPTGNGHVDCAKNNRLFKLRQKESTGVRWGFSLAVIVLVPDF